MTRLIRDLFVFYMLSLALPSLLFAADPARDPFYGMGHELSGNRTFDQVAEYVDPFSGYMTISNTDVVLPGNDGLDVRITRTYNSAIWGRKDVSYPGFIVWNDWSPLGIGWSMHMGIVRNPSGNGSSSYYFPDNPVVEMPDGSQHVLYKDKNNSSQYITKEYWLYKSVGSGMWELTLTDGTVYTFQYNPTGNVGYIDRAGVNVAQVTSIKNPSRTSSITASYQRGANGYSYLSSITDSLNRNINFNYDFTSHRLTSITVDSRTFSYSYQTIYTGPIFGTQNFLTQVTPPTGGGSPWKYDYNSSVNTFDLQKITFPAGGTITYSYGNGSFDTGISDVSFRVVTQRTTGGSNSHGTIPAGTWTYSYSTGGASGNITTITGPGGLSEVHTFNAWGNNCTSAGPCGNIWEIGLPMSKEVKMNGSRILYESYTWTIGTEISHDYISNGDWNSAGVFIYDTVYTPFLSSRSIARDNATYTTNYSLFDTYGNPKNISETGDKTRTTSVDYYWTNATENIVKGKPHTQTVTGGFPGSFSTTYTYDNSSGHVTQMTKYGVTTNYHYFSNGNLDYVTDANNKTTYYQWSNGRISQIRPPETGTTINRVINSNGTIASETNARNYTTSFTYDGILRLASVDPPTGNTTTYTYGTDNSYKKETRGSFYTYYYYDGFGRPAGTSDSKGITTDIEYKSYEVKDYSTSNIGDRASFDYFGRPTSIVHQDNTSIGYAYSGSDVTVTDEALHTTHLYYNAFGNPDEKLLESVTDTNNVSTAYNYNILGSLTNVTLGGSSLGTFSYDATKNFLTSESTPEKGSITYGRDLVGNMTSKVDALGTVSYDYDNNYRLKTITYGSNSVTFGYDGANNRTSMDSPGASIDYTYDSSNRLTIKSETIATRPYTTNFGYDGNDNLTSITYPFGRIVTYGYNANNQVVSVTGFGGSITPVNYCATAPCIGLPLSFTASSAQTTSFSYTPRNLTSHVTTGSSVSNIEYGYADNRGNMTSLTDHINVSPSRNQTMTYDNLNRLYTFNGAWGSGSFTYLANGDRSRKTVAGVNTDYWYSNNRLTSTTGGEAATFSYNNNGDLTSLSGDSLTIDRLHNVTSYNGTPVVSFAYDGDGMRVTKSSSGNTVVYHYDKEGRLLSEDGGNGVLIADYIYLNGKLAAKVMNDAYIVPNAPSNLTAVVASLTQINLTWADNSTNETGFIIERSVGTNTAYSVLTTLGPSQTSYSDSSGFAQNTTYYYRVKATNAGGDSAYNETSTIIRTYIVTASALPASGGSISPSGNVTVLSGVNQTFNITAATGYNILDVLVDNVSVGAVTSYQFSNVTTGHTIGASFRLKAPTNLTATVMSQTQINLGWTVNTADETGFKIERSIGNNLSYAPLITVGSNQPAYSDTSGILQNTTYYYRIRATNASGDSAYSNEASAKVQTYTLTASSGANGNISPSGAVPVFDGNNQTFTLNPDTGYQIATLTVDSSPASWDANRQYKFMAVSTNHTISVAFSPVPYLITVQKISSGGGVGTVTSTTPAGVIDCGAICQASIDYNTPVTLQATGDLQSDCTVWSGAGCSGNGNCSFTVSGPTTIYATFSSSTLTLNKAGTGLGAIASNPAGIFCDQSCQSASARFKPSNTVTLTATPASNAILSSWSEPGCGNSLTCQVTMETDKTVTVTFALKPPVARFSFAIVAPVSGKVPLEIQFTDTSTYNPTAWSWVFGDGSTSAEQNPAHVFETYGTGTYTVALTASNAGGPSVPAATHDITVLACDNLHSVKLLSDTEALYDSISAAYTAAADGETIQSQAVHFTGNLTVDNNMNITLDGGYDCQILQKIGNTTLHGATDPAILINTGSATMDGISIE